MAPGKCLASHWARTAPSSHGAPRQESATSTSGSALSWLPLIGLVAGLVSLLYLVQTSDVATTGYDIQRYEREAGQCRCASISFRLRSRRRSPLESVRARALRLGMVPAEHPYSCRTRDRIRNR